MLYLAVSPREAQDAARYPCRLAYAAYRMGPENSLLRQSLPLSTQGGLLLLSDREAPPLPDPEALAAALERLAAAMTPAAGPTPTAAAAPAGT